MIIFLDTSAWIKYFICEKWENVDIPLVNRNLMKNSGHLAERYFLKGCDTFQLASALAIKATLFVNSDNELKVAIKKGNISALDPSKGEYISETI